MEEVLDGKDYCFPAEERKINHLWDEIHAFRTQQERSSSLPEFVFYDGPPFANGSPHYGHILAGTIKDIVCRFKCMTGHHVNRRFGWDCHGVPVEDAIKKKLNIFTKEDVLKMGIENYNMECRKLVSTSVGEWEDIVRRSGRWIGFKDSYKTMDMKFMESVWWVFAQLYQKGFVYRAFKVSPYSTAMHTQLSNFEADSNKKLVTDPSIIVSFPILSGPHKGAAFVAWTTTPWTLPSNLALCVNADLLYVKVRNKYSGNIYVVAECRLSELPSELSPSKPKKKTDDPLDSYEVLEKFTGLSLIDTKYEPMFGYFQELSDVAFRVVADSSVSDECGTGVVHYAPQFGEDDFRVCLENGIISQGQELIVPLDSEGRFTNKVPEFEGHYHKEVEEKIEEAVKKKGRLVMSGKIQHVKASCRSDKPLIHMACLSWFVAVEKIKDQLLETNKQTYWVPEFVKAKRFHNWLENARDWAIKIVVIDSVDKLEKLSGQKVVDLHREHVDPITIPSSRGPEYGVLKRVKDVFDCWFESGSMPYAYIHYPFENTELFEKNFPGDFVAEGIDQTRGWFYSLMVLSTALFGKPAFKNLICNGLVLAEDGKKMSKSLQNYPSPTEVLDESGGDALRLYLINSPVVRGEDLRFTKDGVKGVIKDVLLPWYNAYRFLVQNSNELKIKGRAATFVPYDLTFVQNSSNVLDQWINSATQSLVHFLDKEMNSYRLYTVVPYLLKLLDNLTNIYVRFNRKRFKGHTGDEDCLTALSTLYHVLLTTCKVMAPFTPFLTEKLYQNLIKACNGSDQKSIHFCNFPQVEGKRDEKIEQSVARMMTVIELAHAIRERHKRPLRAPLREMVIVHPDADFLNDVDVKLRKYVLDELNVQTLVLSNDILMYASLSAKPNYSVLGRRLGRSMREVANGIQAMSQPDIRAFQQAGETTIMNHSLKLSDVKILREFKRPQGLAENEFDGAGDGDVLVALDVRLDYSLVEAWGAREIVSHIQKLRKEAKLEKEDKVEVYLELTESEVHKPCMFHSILNSQRKNIMDRTGAKILTSRRPQFVPEKASQFNETIQDKAEAARDKTADSAQHAKEDPSGFLQQTGEQVKNAAQGAVDTVKNTLGMNEQTKK
ncbi:Isoleucine--tRNA ligase cytoplasmic [Euphorbia peplus]|nr:Isoleucine--tRNA ligase cytoplasmic [Euphorbia peplus]